MQCSRCGSTVPKEYQFCLECGQDLGTPTVLRTVRHATDEWKPIPIEPAEPDRSHKKRGGVWFLSGFALALIISGTLVGLVVWYSLSDHEIKVGGVQFEPTPGQSELSSSPVKPTPTETPTGKASEASLATMLPTAPTTPTPRPTLASPVASSPTLTPQPLPIIYSGKDVDVMVRIISKPQPQYTEEARKNQIIGTVNLRAIFADDATIRQIVPISTLPFGLTERAVAAARNITFVPAQKDGRNVSTYVQLEYNFNLY